MLEFSPGIENKLQKIFGEMERAASAALRGEGFSKTKQRHERSLTMRYKGQSFELQIKQTSKGLAASFHRAHLERYGYAQETNSVEIASARLRSSGIVDKLAETRMRASRQAGYAKPAKYVTAYFAGKKLRVALYRRDELRAGAKLRAPCIVTEYSSTTWIPQGSAVAVDEFGNLIIEVR
jgi:N-methylhydantoinase A